MATQQETRFLRVVDDAGAINAGVTTQLNLNTIKNKFGRNFNTIFIDNGADEEISITLDGVKVVYIGSGDAWSIDYRDNLIFTNVSITNEDGATNTSANEIRVSVGRTGVKK